MRLPEKIILKYLLSNPIACEEDIMRIKRGIAKKYYTSIVKNSDVLKLYRNLIQKKKIENSPLLEALLKKRSVRTFSGVAPIAVLTKPYPCPGRCIFCPTEKKVPQSYLSNEPAVMRAIRCGYAPYTQVQLRLQALVNNGHNPEKIELIVIGGTWSALPKKYKYWYIKECFRAANEFGKKQKAKSKRQNNNLKLEINLIKKQITIEQAKNEGAKYKIIGLTLETRPDYISDKELQEMRELGCTRVELGVQAIDDKILEINRRGHDVEEIARATRLLKNFGFKTTYHIMPGLLGSNPAYDFAMFKKIFCDERFQPDQIKFYPTVVTKGSLLYKSWKAGKYKPYPEKQLKNLILQCKNVVPPYVRIIRLIRDIPEESIIAGNRITNLRQIIKNQGAKCRCIRCREPKNTKLKLYNIFLKIIRYKSSKGVEYFFSYEDKKSNQLYGFCRLRLALSNPEIKCQNFFPEINKAALIRELHVYGELTSLGKRGNVQHIGLGKKLLQEAEKMAKREGFKKIAVISGVGARNYYRKLGYRLSNTYMVKLLRENCND